MFGWKNFVNPRESRPRTERNVRANVRGARGFVAVCRMVCMCVCVFLALLLIGSEVGESRILFEKCV